MNNEQLRSLFLSIFNREPNTKEFELYNSYSFEDLKNILLSSTEKQQLLFNMSGERFRHFVEYGNDDIEQFFTTNNFKIAICLSGHIRDYKGNLASINKYLVKPLNADVFMHTWDSVGKQIVITKNVLGPIPNEYNKDMPNLYETITNLKKLEIENNQQFISSVESNLGEKQFYLYGQSLGDNYYGGQAEPKYIYSQFYSIYKSFKLLESYSIEQNIKYDIVIKLRSDYCLSSGIFVEDFEVIRNNINLDKKCIFVPDLPYSNHGHPLCCLCKTNIEHTEHYEDTCDVFAYSDYESMKHYMTVYEKLEILRDLQVKKNNNSLSNKQYTDIQRKDKNYLIDIWKFPNYELECFYPERIFNKHLQNFKLCPSKLTGLVLR